MTPNHELLLQAVIWETYCVHQLGKFSTHANRLRMENAISVYLKWYWSKWFVLTLPNVFSLTSMALGLRFNIHHSTAAVFMFWPNTQIWKLIYFSPALFPSLSLSLFLCPLLSRLALYVYEYLLHVGAQKSAQTFLSEVGELKSAL